MFRLPPPVGGGLGRGAGQELFRDGTNSPHPALRATLSPKGEGKEGKRARYCGERSDTAIHATVELLETLPQIARLQLDRHVPCGHSQ
jgi:hypothetical protein